MLLKKTELKLKPCEAFGKKNWRRRSLGHHSERGEGGASAFSPRGPCFCAYALVKVL